MDVGILGGTGPAGQAMAARMASVGLSVVIGSRSAERATVAGEEVRKRWPDLDLDLTGGTNPEAAAATLVVVATPWDAAAATAASVAEALAGKVVVSMANGLVPEGRELRPVVPPEGSVAQAVQRAVPEALVTAAFHHLPAKAVADLSRPVQGDVVICGASDEAVAATADLVERLPDLRAVHAGSLALAGAVEEFTAVLLAVNRRHKARSTVRFVGIGD
ncbi:MAG: NADPH-dependent F420 reductase [Actinomycetota bacterium]|jgi:8-hydroxy-5-deazaflavin:NADPH oxidoreductase